MATASLSSARLLAVALALAPASAAAGALDQHQDQTSNLFSSIGGPTSQNDDTIAQTFTAGLTGQLDQADLYLEHFTGGTDPVTLEVRDVDASGAPGSTVLASATFTPPLDPAWVPVQFSAPASVTAGTRYALVAYTSGDSVWGWSLIGSGNPYPAGAAFISQTLPPTTWTERTDQDQAFRTYVAASGADLEVAMSGPGTTAARSEVTYTLTVTNHGPSQAAGVVLVDNLPQGVRNADVTTSQGACTVSGKKAPVVTCQLGALASGSAATVSVKVEVFAAPAPTALTNVASVSSDTDDPDPANNAASLSTQVVK